MKDTTKKDTHEYTFNLSKKWKIEKYEIQKYIQVERIYIFPNHHLKISLYDHCYKQCTKGHVE